tara:strand:+ start:259 stop:1128 length:870 start_codon:yes stop_codon:yes gene_type:complete
MKTSKKVLIGIIIFFIIIAIVVIGRTMVGNHFKKKFSKRPPPGIIVKLVSEKIFSEKIESFGTAISKKTKSYRIQKSDLISELKLDNYVEKGSLIIKLKDKDIIAPFDGILGYRGITEDVLGSDNSLIITLDDSSVIYADLKIPESFALAIKKNLPVDVKFSGLKDKIFSGTVDGYSSRISADTRSLLTRIKINNQNYELIPGSLLEVSVKFNERSSLSIPDTSVMLEGESAFVYKVLEDNSLNKIQIKIGNRDKGFIEVISGLNKDDLIVAEGLKKVNPKGKIKPIKK